MDEKDAAASPSDTYAAERILKEVSDIVSSIDDVQRVMDQLVELTTSLLKVGNCSLVLIDRGTDMMRIRAAFGLSREIVEGFRQRIGEGITGWVAKTGKPLLIEDVETHPLFRRPSSSRYTTKSLLSVPLIHHQLVIGVLNVNNRNDNRLFTRQDELLLSVLANFIVISLEKAQMRERLVETERMEADLRVARTIQERILPDEIPSTEKWEFAARNVPARQVAGDFFDALPLPEDRTCVVLGDVCGKGVPAALYMARVMGYYRVVSQVRHTASGIMAFVNDLLASEWTEHTFVTASLCVFDNQSGKISFCSAGHPTPLRLRQATGEVAPLVMDHGLPLGIEPGIPFESSEMDTDPGDTFVLYTDGITEAKSRAGEMFRDIRLRALMAGHRGSAESLAEKIIAAVDSFSGLDTQLDDVTLVVIKRI
jgi:sigma-B regulation protein RsbU (phosphoserine phosphatase)